MRLYLVRHGDAVTAEQDIQRPLSHKGQDEVSTMAKFLQANNISVDQIYHSGKLRAEQTAIALAAGKVTGVPVAILPGMLPDDPVSPVAISCNGWKQDVILVGHLPFMAKLVSELVLDRTDMQLVDFQTSAILCLERIAIFHWCISWLMNPSLLSSAFR
jgi:phosphohistidine phosphatase